MNREKENINAYYMERTKAMIKEIEKEKQRKREEFVKKYKEEKAAAYGNDIALRREIHKMIRDSISQEKDKDEVEKELLSNKKYEKYFSFIPNWVNDGFNKKNSKVNREFNRFNNRYK